MTLKEIASVSGKPGLYRVHKPTRTGIILETIDEQKKKLIANSNSRVSLLQEISVYTTSDEGSVLLENVLQTIKSKKEGQLEVGSSEKELFDFLQEIVPDFDTERVYASDVKKMVAWYNILNKFHPELLVAEKTTQVEKADKTTKKDDAPKAEKKAKTPKTTAAPKIATGKKGGGSTAVKSAKRGA